MFDGEKHPRNDISKRWVLNLSTIALSKPQGGVLSKGLNFAPTPTFVPVLEIIAAVECTMHKLKAEDASNLHNKVGGLREDFEVIID